MAIIFVQENENPVMSTRVCGKKIGVKARTGNAFIIMTNSILETGCRTRDTVKETIFINTTMRGIMETGETIQDMEKER